MSGGDTASNKDSGDSQPTTSSMNDYVALIGLVLVGILVIIVVWFYGTGTAGEASAAGVLGLAFTAIGSIVGTVFGVNAGTKSGTAGGVAGGQQLARGTTRSATKALTSTIQSVQNLKHEAARFSASQSEHHAKVKAHMAAGTAPPPPPDIAPLQQQIDETLARAQGALDVISAGP